MSLQWFEWEQCISQCWCLIAQTGALNSNNLGPLHPTITEAPPLASAGFNKLPMCNQHYLHFLGGWKMHQNTLQIYIIWRQLYNWIIGRYIWWSIEQNLGKLGFSCLTWELQSYFHTYFFTSVNLVHNAPRRSPHPILRIFHSGSLPPIKTPRTPPPPPPPPPSTKKIKIMTLLNP
jgi:hypothetical protein